MLSGLIPNQSNTCFTKRNITIQGRFIFCHLGRKSQFSQSFIKNSRIEKIYLYDVGQKSQSSQFFKKADIKIYPFDENCMLQVSPVFIA